MMSYEWMYVERRTNPEDLNAALLFQAPAARNENSDSSADLELNVLYGCIMLETITILTASVAVLSLEVEELPVFNKWLLILITLELLMTIGQSLLYRCLVNGSSSNVVILFRYMVFLVENLWLAWNVYGNVLYFTAKPAETEDFMLWLMIFFILLINYLHALKYFVDFLLLCLVWPLQYCSEGGFRHAPSRADLEALISSLPQGKYAEGLYHQERKCVICLEMFQDQDWVTYLPCDPRHNFHTGCIEAWLRGNTRCPMCKTEVTVEAVRRCGRCEELMDFLKQKDEESFLSTRRSSSAQ